MPKIRESLVKVTFPSHFQHLNGSLSKSLSYLEVYFRAVHIISMALAGQSEENNLSQAIGGQW